MGGGGGGVWFNVKVNLSCFRWNEISGQLLNLKNELSSLNIEKRSEKNEILAWYKK